MQKISDFSTYHTGILQARAYRTLRLFMTRELDVFNLSSTEWSILGTINDHSEKGGIRASDLAALLDVKNSFITNSTKKLTEENLIVFSFHEDDARVRLLSTTEKGKKKTLVVERHMREKMKSWLKDIENEELVVYIHVLLKISKLGNETS